MDFMSILLCLILAGCEGNWSVHLETVYLFDMREVNETASTVYIEFLGRNFVLKHIPQKFNNLSTNQVIKFVRSLCKVCGGFGGTTRTESVISR